MQTEDAKVERKFESLTPVRLRSSVRKKILEKIGAMFVCRRSPCGRPSNGFIQVAVPFGIAALFLATTSGHFLATVGEYSANASRHIALVNCATQQVDGGRLELLSPPAKSSSNEVVDMSGHTNGFDIIGRTRGCGNAAAQAAALVPERTFGDCPVSVFCAGRTGERGAGSRSR